LESQAEIEEKPSPILRSNSKMPSVIQLPKSIPILAHWTFPLHQFWLSMDYPSWKAKATGKVLQTPPLKACPVSISWHCAAYMISTQTWQQMHSEHDGH
jgi:hypothetical protein